MQFRSLRADEMECRVQSIKEGKGNNVGKAFVILLLYKDARCDQRILDETVGIMGWQRRHDEHKGNLFCSVGIRDTESKEWIWKEDAGSESREDAEKGHASDSFKRACFNWGIGRALYTAPFIYFELYANEFYKDDKGKMKTSAGVEFHVKTISYKDDSIEHLEIADKKGSVRWKI